MATLKSHNFRQYGPLAWLKNFYQYQISNIGIIMSKKQLDSHIVKKF